MPAQLTDVCLANIPLELKSLRQWVCWRTVMDKDGKPTKRPYQLNGNLASTTDPTTWNSFEAVTLLTGYDGIGFVFKFPYVGIDLDHHFENGKLSDYAQYVVAIINSYTEISPSGKGLHIIAKGKLMQTGNKNKTLNIEFYDHERFFTVTGNHYPDTPVTVEERQDELNDLHREVFPLEKPKSATYTPPAISIEDDDLIDKAMSASNGNGFTSLWNGDTSKYLGADGKPDESAADFAMCLHLAFWTGKDPSRMDRLFRQTKLMREKWNRQDYRERTIKRAIELTRETYDPHNREISNTLQGRGGGKGRGVIGGRGESHVQSVTDEGENRIESVTEGVTETLQGVTTVTGVTNVTGDVIKAYIQESNGAWIEYRDLDSDLGIRTPEQKVLRRVTINRLNNDKFIEKHPSIATKIRLIKKNIEPMNLDFETIQYPLALKLPFGIENKVDLYPRSMAVIAGSKDAGKTAFCLNVARWNCDLMPVHYFNSEMGEVEMVKRLRNFDDCLEWKDKVQWIDRAAGFEDVIFPEDINIIDFLEITQEFYLIGSLLTAIHKKLTTGIALIAIQKDAKALLGRGNTFGMEKARLYLTLNHLDGINTAKIESGKIWHKEGDNPRGQYVNYKLVKGSLFTNVSEWRVR